MSESKKLIEVVSGSSSEDFNEFLESSHQLAYEKSIVGVVKNVGHIALSQLLGQ